jgi:hypothetical protein
MVPHAIPPGTTLRSLLEEILPADHAANVPRDAGKARLALGFTGGRSYALSADGSRLEVRETPRVEPAPLLIGLEEASADLLLADWMGPRKLVPSFQPSGLAALTDPRLLRKLAEVDGTMAITLEGLAPGRRDTMLVAAGRDPSLYDDPDVRIELSMAALSAVLTGKLRPDRALDLDGVTVLWKKRIAVQFALALVSYFPAA